MNKVIKAIVFPYDREFAPLLKYKDMLKNTIITGVISPIGWGLCDKDASSVYIEGEKFGYTPYSTITDELLNKSNTLWIIESSHKLKFENIFNSIKEVVEHNINIIITRKLSKLEYVQIIELCESNGVQCTIPFGLYNDGLVVPEEELDYERIPLENINTPVIFISGICEMTNKKYVQLAIRKRLLDTGYKISQIGTENYCEMFGFHSFPAFMNNNSINETQKILLLNGYIKELEVTEQPDIIIIGVPGGIMPINKNNKINFGIYAYEIANSVNPDVVVMCLLNENYNSDYFSELQQLVKYRFNYAIDYYCISNYRMDQLSLEQVEEIKYISVSKQINESVINKLKKENTAQYIFNPLDDSDCDELCEYINDKLSEYGDSGIL